MSQFAAFTDLDEQFPLDGVSGHAGARGDLDIDMTQRLGDHHERHAGAAIPWHQHLLLDKQLQGGRCEMMGDVVGDI